MSTLLSHSSVGLLPDRSQHHEAIRAVEGDAPLEVVGARFDYVVSKLEPAISDVSPYRSMITESKVHEAIDDPHRLANEVLALYAHREGKTLAHYRSEFHIYNGVTYRSAPEFKAGELVRGVKSAVDRGFAITRVSPRRQKAGQESSDDSGPIARPRTVPKVTKGLVGDVAQALVSMVGIAGEADAPFWMSPRSGDPDPINIMHAANGPVDLGGDQPVLMSHSPRLFSTNVLPYDYNPDAPRPERWLEFLADQWANDPESIDSLHEVIGYLLTADNRLHKMFLMIGPPRSGKSTIKDIVTALIGERNVASCSPSSMGSPFGLEPLLGKTVAIMADARTDGNSSVMLDRLMRITGGDSVEINRKNRPILANVRLGTRFIYVSNELPSFRDASKGITSRYHILRMSKVVPVERRDPNLLAKLLVELPGILNLAIEGRARLLSRGRFLQPSSGANLLANAEDLASPVGEFVSECFIVDPSGCIPRAEAYEAWKEWAEKTGRLRP